MLQFWKYVDAVNSNVDVFLRMLFLFESFHILETSTELQNLKQNDINNKRRLSEYTSPNDVTYHMYWPVTCDLWPALSPVVTVSRSRSRKYEHPFGKKADLLGQILCGEREESSENQTDSPAKIIIWMIFFCFMVGVAGAIILGAGDASRRYSGICCDSMRILHM